MSWFLLFYAIWVIVISGYTFVTYGIDKRAAQNQKSRIPEKRLHLQSLVGGWPGGLWGRRFFRHKTKKQSFLWVEAVVIFLHLAVVTAIIYWLAA